MSRRGESEMCVVGAESLTLKLDASWTQGSHRLLLTTRAYVFVHDLFSGGMRETVRSDVYPWSCRPVSWRQGLWLINPSVSRTVLRAGNIYFVNGEWAYTELLSTNE